MSVFYRLQAVKDRHLLPATPYQKVENIAPYKGGKISCNEEKKLLRKRKKISKVCNLEALWAPRVLRQTVVKNSKEDGVKAIYTSPRGDVISERSLNFGGHIRDKWVYTRANCGVKGITEKIGSFQFMLHVIAEFGLNPKVEKLFNRVLMVGFNIHKDHLRKMVSKVALACGYRYETTRNPRGLAAYLSTAFTGETKSIRKYGIKVPLWNCSRT